MPARTLCLLLVLLCSCASHDRAAPIASNPEDAVVRVEASGGSAPRSTISSGVIIGPGRIVTTLSAIRSADEVWITTADARRARVSGVAALDRDHDLVLLSADWRGNAPPAVLPGRSPPSKDAAVTVISREGEHAPERFRAIVTHTGSSMLQISLSHRAALGYLGSPVFDDDGKLVALVTQSALGVYVQIGSPPIGVLNELIATSPAGLLAKNWELTTWETWKQRTALMR